MGKFERNFVKFIDAGLPILYVDTFAEDEGKEIIINLCKEINRNIVEWNLSSVVYRDREENYQPAFMNIKDTLTTFEQKLKELDDMEVDYENAKQCDNEIAMRGIVKAEEKVADYLESLVRKMDDSDLPEIYAELELEKIGLMTEALRNKTADLSDLIEDYGKSAQAGNQLEDYRLMKSIRKVGREISYIEMETEER